MRHAAGAVLPLILPFICGQCAGSRAPTGQSGSASSEGYVDAAEGVRLFYRMLGSGGDTVVVLHGGPGFSMTYLAPDLEPLAAHHVLLFYDQRGAGRSTLVTDSVALDAQRFADDLEAVRAHFGFRRLTLFAHSWGAAVAALYAARHSDRIGRLLIVDGISVRRTHHTRISQVLDSRRDSIGRRRLQQLAEARRANPGDRAACRAFFDQWFVAAYADSTAGHRRRGDFCADAPEAIANKLTRVDLFTLPSLGDWDWRAAMRAVNAPTLVTRGTMDYVPLESAREWAASAPNGRLLLLDRAGHFPYFETPEGFFAAAEEFLQGRWPAGAEQVRVPGPG